MNKCSGETSPVLRNGNTVETKLLRIAGKARNEPKFKFTSLFHLLNEELLRECFKRLRKEAAPGIDQITKEMYAKELETNLKRLVEGLHGMTYIPQSVRRVYIPKQGSNKKRPLGIPVLEDKIVQAGLKQILESIYEEDFIKDSYGFRPGRGCHEALRQLSRTVEKETVSYVVEADIKGFFDNVSHEWMMKFLAHRIADKRVLRMIKRFLKAGVMEAGVVYKGDKGTPQGGTISPILANIYLHYVLDLWFEKVYRKRCEGYARIIRYCDDFIVCFKQKADALRFKEELIERLAKFGLEVVPSKTKVIAFGRFAIENAKRESKKPETFDFLGFTHYCSKTRDGKYFRMKRKTSKKKFNAKLKLFKEWLKSVRTLPTKILMDKVSVKLQGHYAYYGVTDNSDAISRFAYEVRKILHKWLNRRGKKKCLDWSKFCLLLTRYPLPKPRIMVCLF